MFIIRSLVAASCRHIRVETLDSAAPKHTDKTDPARITEQASHRMAEKSTVNAQQAGNKLLESI